MIWYRRFIWWYLAAPVFLFLLTWFTPFIGWPLACMLLFAVSNVSRYANIPEPLRPRLTLSLLLRIVLTLRFAMLVTWSTIDRGYWDWVRHRALFFDLSRCGWPMSYDIHDSHLLLSYYIAFYLPAALFTKLLGMDWMPRLIYLWVSMGYGLLVWGLFSRSKSFIGWGFLFALALCCSAWPDLLLYVRFGNWAHMNTAPTYLEPFWWVPNHLIPTGLCAILLLHPDTRRENRVRFAPLLVALVFYWSPLSATALALLVLADLLKEKPVAFIMGNKRVLLYCFLLVLPYELYLARDLSKYPHSWVFYSWKDFWTFVVFMILPHILIAWLLGGWRLYPGYMTAAVAILVVCPFYSYGAFNDFNLRFDLVAYTFLLFITAEGGLHLLRHLLDNDAKVRQRMIRLGLAVLLMAGSLLTHKDETLTFAGEFFGSNPLISINLVNFNFPYTRTLAEVKGTKLDKIEDHYMTSITHLKSALLRDIEICPRP